jgi:UMF1 family MFS transporter
MAAMFFVKDSPSHLWLGLVLLAVGNVFFEFAEVSYNSILLSISTPQNVGRISGIGWGMGYLGGLALLVLLLVTVISPEVGLFGAVDEDGFRYRIVAVMAAAWFLLFALPVLFLAPPSPVAAGDATPQQEAARRQSGLTGWFRLFLADYRRLIGRIIRLWRDDRLTLRFLIASAVFRDGLAAIFAFAGVLAAGSYGLSPSEVILLGVVANISAGVGAIAAGWLDDRLGSPSVIMTGLVCLILASAPIAVSDSPVVFWSCAVFMCLFVGPVQSSSRAFLARITPPEEAGENFGLYATTGRAVSFIGPVMFALFIALLGYQRAGALGIAVVLAAGLALFWSMIRSHNASNSADRSTS